MLRNLKQVYRVSTCSSRMLFSSVSRADIVASTDAKWIAQLVGQVATTGDATHADALDEYFRKNFRKVSFEDALATLKVLGCQANALDSSFWTWETLEEAVIGRVDEMDKETYVAVLSAFLQNQKGSTDLIDQLETRLYQETVDSPLQGPVDVKTFAGIQH